MARYYNKGSIISWLGGKSPVKAKIIPLMPETRVYVEPFGGAANVILSKGPSEVEVYNDMNPFLVSFFRTIKDPDKLNEFLIRVRHQLYSRDAKKIARTILFADRSDKTEMDLAVSFYVAQNQGFSGTGSFRKGDSWGISLGNSIPFKWSNSEKWLFDYSDRLRNVTIEMMDAVQVVRKYDAEDALIYLDPPYVPSTRSMGGCAEYDVDYSYEQHQELLDTMLHMKGMAIISGYPNALYDDTLMSRGWTKLSWKVTSSAVVRTRSQGSKVGKLKHGQEECIWVSPNTQLMQGDLLMDDVVVDDETDTTEELSC